MRSYGTVWESSGVLLLAYEDTFEPLGSARCRWGPVTIPHIGNATLGSIEHAARISYDV